MQKRLAASMGLGLNVEHAETNNFPRNDGRLRSFVLNPSGATTGCNLEVHRPFNVGG